MHQHARLFPAPGRGHATRRLAVLIAGVVVVVACACDEPTGPGLRACADPDPQRYVRARNPRSQQHVRWPDVEADCLAWATAAEPHVRAAAAAAFDAWAAPTCSPLCFVQRVDAGANALLADEPHVRSDGDNLNAVVVETSAQAWQARFGNLALSATLVTSDDLTGDILDADILVNAADYTFVDVDEGQGCPDALHADLRNVLTHEVGHLLGFAHTSNPETTMFGSWSQPEPPACETLKRDLAEGDLDGLCTVYGACATNGDAAADD